MHPILFNIGKLTLKTYGLFVAIGVLLGYNYARYYGVRLKNINSEFLSNLLFYSILIGFLGGRLFYVILNYSYYSSDLIGIFRVWEGGFVFYGGFILGSLFGVLYTYIKKQNLLDILDVVAAGLYLGLSIGRIGCFFAGCCYGKPTESCLGVIFSDPESLAPIGVKILPTQLFESVYSFLIFLLLNFLLQKGKLQHRLFFLGGMIYAVFRFANEFLRGDDRGGTLFGLYPSQFISIIIFVLFFVLFFYISKWKEKYSK